MSLSKVVKTPQRQENNYQDQETYQVQRILQRGRLNDQVHYLVQWKGYPMSEASWQPLSHLSQCKQAIEEFQSLIKKLETETKEGGNMKKTQKRAKRLTKLKKEDQLKEDDLKSKIKNDKNHVQINKHKAIQKTPKNVNQKNINLEKAKQVTKKSSKNPKRRNCMKINLEQQASSSQLSQSLDPTTAQSVPPKQEQISNKVVKKLSTTINKVPQKPETVYQIDQKSNKKNQASSNKNKQTSKPDPLRINEGYQKIIKVIKQSIQGQVSLLKEQKTNDPKHNKIQQQQKNQQKLCNNLLLQKQQNVKQNDINTCVQQKLNEKINRYVIANQNLPQKIVFQQQKQKQQPIIIQEQQVIKPKPIQTQSINLRYLQQQRKQQPTTIIQIIKNSQKLTKQPINSSTQPNQVNNPTLTIIPQTQSHQTKSKIPINIINTNKSTHSNNNNPPYYQQTIKLRQQNQNYKNHYHQNNNKQKSGQLLTVQERCNNKNDNNNDNDEKYKDKIFVNKSGNNNIQNKQKDYQSNVINKNRDRIRLQQQQSIKISEVKKQQLRNKNNYYNKEKVTKNHSHRIKLYEQQIKETYEQYVDKIIQLVKQASNTNTIKNNNNNKMKNNLQAQTSMILKQSKLLGNYLDLTQVNNYLSQKHLQKLISHILTKQQVQQLDQNGDLLRSSIQITIKVDEKTQDSTSKEISYQQKWIALIECVIYDDKLQENYTRRYLINIEDLRQDIWKKLFRKFCRKYE